MGAQPHKNGVYVQFLDENGDIDETKSAIYGTVCEFHANNRSVKPGDRDPKYGSQDWFTQVLFANDEKDLAALPHTSTTVAYSSTASKGVAVTYSAPDSTGAMVHQTLTDCVTIAQGYASSKLYQAPGSPSGSGDPSKVVFVVNHLLVMPKKTVMDQNHPLWDAWTFAVHPRGGSLTEFLQRTPQGEPAIQPNGSTEAQP